MRLVEGGEGGRVGEGMGEGKRKGKREEGEEGMWGGEGIEGCKGQRM